MRNAFGLSAFLVVGIELAFPAKAYLVDDAQEYPKGTTEAEIRARFAGAKVTPISFPNQPGMSGFMYPNLFGRPTFEFCHEMLTATWTAIDGADLIQFRHLVEENSRFLGGANMRMMGQTDSFGKEWTAISANWPLSDDRTATVEVSEYVGQGMLVEQKVIDENGCLRSSLQRR